MYFHEINWIITANSFRYDISLETTQFSNQKQEKKNIKAIKRWKKCLTHAIWYVTLLIRFTNNNSQAIPLFRCVCQKHTYFGHAQLSRFWTSPTSPRRITHTCWVHSFICRLFFFLRFVMKICYENNFFCYENENH